EVYGRLPGPSRAVQGLFLERIPQRCWVAVSVAEDDRLVVAMYPAAQPETQPVENDVPVPSHAPSAYCTTFVPGAARSTKFPRLAYDAMFPCPSRAVTASAPGSAAGYVGVTTGVLPAAAKTSTPWSAAVWMRFRRSTLSVSPPRLRLMMFA